jgi:hypothetical protein
MNTQTRPDDNTEIIVHYNRYGESNRLKRDLGLIEWERSRGLHHEATLGGLRPFLACARPGNQLAGPRETRSNSDGSVHDRERTAPLYTPPTE